VHLGLFARDVAVNVIANLVAASILYLVGAGVGLLPTNGTLLISTAFVVAFALGVAIWIAEVAIYRGPRRFKSRKPVMLSSVALGLLGAAGVLAAFIPDMGLSLFEKVWYVIGGTSGITQASLTVYSQLAKPTHPSSHSDDEEITTEIIPSDEH
jgi:tellurite resistance protein TehA-like permease